MTPSPALIEFLKAWEGCELMPYQDAGGAWTVGYGCLLPLRMPTDKPISQFEADSMLAAQVQKVAEGIEGMVDYVLAQNEVDALISFAYNVGLGALKKSTLLRRLNQGDIDGAALEFGRWNKVGTKIVAGLINRRAAEKAMFLHADYSGRP